MCVCVGGPRVSDFFYYESKFKIKKIFFFGGREWGRGGGGDPNLKKKLVG